MGEEQGGRRERGLRGREGERRVGGEGETARAVRVWGEGG